MKKLVTILIFLPLLQPTFARDMVLGYEYDITREKVPTEATLRRVADIVSSLGYTQLQLYFKDNFAYPEHPEVWRNRAHVTPEEIRAFDGYCKAKGLELVPYQSSFGHLEPWVTRPEYRTYAEHPTNTYYNTEHKREMKSSAVCPPRPRRPRPQFWARRRHRP